MVSNEIEIKVVREPKNLTDEVLVQMVKSKNLGAFDELMARHQEKIFNLVMRMMGDYHLANDLSQTVFLKAFKAIGSFKGKSAFSTWLYRIALNVCSSERRKIQTRKKRGMVSLDRGRREDEEGVSREVADFSEEPTRRLVSLESERAVYQAIQDLDEEFRTVVVLRDLEGHSYEEIAELIGWPLGTIRSRLHRARLILRDKLKEFLPE